MYIFVLQFLEYMYIYISYVIIFYVVKVVYVCFNQNEKVFVLYIFNFNDIRIMILYVSVLYLYIGRIRFEILEFKLLLEQIVKQNVVSKQFSRFFYIVCIICILYFFLDIQFIMVILEYCVVFFLNIRDWQYLINMENSGSGYIEVCFFI